MAAKKGFRVVYDRDRGLSAFLRKADASGHTVRVGIQGREAEDVHPGGISMATLGAVHEFGSPTMNVPQRSFLRATSDANEDRYRRMMRKAAQRLIKSPQTYDEKAELFELGETIRADVIQTIRDRIPPPLKPKTVARKKKREDVPLIDEGLLIGSIRSVVK